MCARLWGEIREKDVFGEVSLCDRCACETIVTTVSMFNTEIICLDCKKKEREHPLYEAAQLADDEQIRQGNYNFQGIGKPADL